MISLTMLGAIVVSPWIWREFPAFRGITILLIPLSGKQWIGSQQDDIVAKLGIPTTKEITVTLIDGHQLFLDERNQNSVLVSLNENRLLTEMDKKKFNILVDSNLDTNSSFASRRNLLENLGKVGTTQDFRNHFEKLRRKLGNFGIDECWYYDIGEGTFGRSLMATFDQLGNLRKMEIIYKDVRHSLK